MIVKICGVKNKETILCCENHNVNFFGMIFYNQSPRNIFIDDAKVLLDFSKNLKIQGVGVFVNENINKLYEYINYLDLKFVQLHGDENEEYIKKVKKFNVKIIKKISIETKKDIEKIKNFKNIDFFLFDYKPRDNELPGGNSKSFNWKIIKDMKLDKPWFLSGGINKNNINILKNDIIPYGIDLSSGVEKIIGVKDNNIITNFMNHFRDEQKI